MGMNPMHMDIRLIFEKVGFRLQSNLTREGEDVTFLSINNPDGSVRWLWPAALREPLFLKFYHPGSFRARMLSLAIRTIFRFRLQKRFFQSHTFRFLESFASIVPLKGHWALFTGTPGPNRKAIIAISEERQTSFIKVGLTPDAQRLIENEVKTLEFLSNLGLKRFRLPQLRGVSTDVIELSEVPGRIGVDDFTRKHEIALRELRDRTFHRIPLVTMQAWRDTKATFERLLTSPDPRIPKELFRKLEKCLAGIGREQVIDTAVAHGDFTPWNTRVAKTSVSVFDWELSRGEMPVGFDAFHYIIQNAILVHRLPWSKIELLLERLYQKNALLGEYSSEKHKLYLSLYLVIHTVYYLDVYSRQQQWHEQITWLLNTWNEALSSILQNDVSHRSLLAMDVMNVLSNQPYAVLKDEGELPEQVGPFSDIDIVMERSTYEFVSDYIRHHCLVVRTVKTERSNMASLKIFLVDGSILCLDFIWQIKRKAIDFMAVAPILRRRVRNAHGIQTASPADDARFVAMFYALNHAAVPAAYTALAGSLDSSESAMDELLAGYIRYRKEGNAIEAMVRTRIENRGIRGWKNKWNYLVDSARSMTRTRGMVITFSGVDGAGKSTIIGQLKERLEKQLRKRVIVLRHRPSLLPILSAWTKGKEQAEADAANTLPRRGTNQSRVSSIARFLYYYLDYLIGQFYVMVRYVWRDYVVLYDRYYFDFISDGRRSNIDLPPSVARAGYSLILRPTYNFFLYASPERILERKQELDRTAIELLTSRYLRLFRQLGGSKNKRYISIENNEASSTLGTIFDYISKAS